MRTVPYGEADLIVTLFTETAGVVSAISRGARRIRKGAAVCLEPMHSLTVQLSERAKQNLMTLATASIDRPRTRLVADLQRLDAAGRALRWVRETVPPRTPEPEVWSELELLLDRLDQEDLDVPASSLLAESGLRLVRALGYGLHLESCVSCGRPCPTDQASCLDPARGGLICRACGGSPVVLKASLRARMTRALLHEHVGFDGPEADVILDVVEHVLRAHADLRA